MKLISIFAMIFSVSAAHAVEYRVKCNAADSVKTVTLSQDPRGLLACQVDSQTKLAKVTMRGSVDMNLAGQAYVIQGAVNTVGVFADCRDAVKDAERMFSAKIVDSVTDAAYSVVLTHEGVIRISSAKSECQGKLSR